MNSFKKLLSRVNKQKSSTAGQSGNHHVYRCPYCKSVLDGARPGCNITCAVCHNFFSIIDDSKTRFGDYKYDHLAGADGHHYRITIYVGVERWHGFEMKAASGAQVTAQLEMLKRFEGRLEEQAELVRRSLQRPQSHYCIERAYVEWDGNYVQFCGTEQWNQWVAVGEACGKF